MNRRVFCRLVAVTPSGLNATLERFETPERTTAEKTGFPGDDYTPFGYLDNPWHSWALHRSGVLRSAPGIGFSLFYPAGPGGYFSFEKNNIYEAELTLQFNIGGESLRTQQQFATVHLRATHHSKNLLTYAFQLGSLDVTCTFLQVNEDAIGTLITLAEASAKRTPVRVFACHRVQLGGESWWGRDGLSGGFDAESDTLWIRSFATGPVFALTGSATSAGHVISTKPFDIAPDFTRGTSGSPKTSYFPAPLYGALVYDFEVTATGTQSLGLLMARGTNMPQAVEHARASLGSTRREIARKEGEDAQFWNSAPRLSGNWPAHWKRGWVYDFETLRMMVRRPIGLYKHPWDPMQIQAPRNVLAETSIDMWALSYADPDSAKQVFLGQFQDAVSDNVPCMREDGTMNMVAADGSECGTSISWCFPYFCAESIFDRTRDLVWLRSLYPRLSALLRWTLTNRSDRGGFLVGKCSWETGMDASKRFLIEQPTGGELTEFIRLVELQAAAAHAGRVLARFAAVVGDGKSVQEWQAVADRFTAHTQELWKDGWFRDFDARSMQFVTSVAPDPAQSAPAFCGVATENQRDQMRPVLRQIYQNSHARGGNPAEGWDDGLAWSSLMLPYLESIWASNDRPLAAEVVFLIAQRIYRSMDRRSVEQVAGTDSALQLGWPGVSCEVWGAHGAFGGEGYGWGAVMPAHIIRSIAGARETHNPREMWLCPNLPPDFIESGKRYGLSRLRWGTIADPLDVEYHVLDSGRLSITVTCARKTQVKSIRAGKQVVTPSQDGMSRFHFEASNHEQCLIEFTLSE